MTNLDAIRWHARAARSGRTALGCSRHGPPLAPQGRPPPPSGGRHPAPDHHRPEPRGRRAARRPDAGGARSAGPGAPADEQPGRGPHVLPRRAGGLPGLRGGRAHRVRGRGGSGERQRSPGRAPVLTRLHVPTARARMERGDGGDPGRDRPGPEPRRHGGADRHRQSLVRDRVGGADGGLRAPPPGAAGGLRPRRRRGELPARRLRRRTGADPGGGHPPHRPLRRSRGARVPQGGRRGPGGTPARPRGERRPRPRGDRARHRAGGHAGDVPDVERTDQRGPHPGRASGPSPPP